jgi:hypothetical protein
MSRAWLLFALALPATFGGWSADARADDKLACLDAHHEAQLLRRSGRLAAAREKLLACAATACPAIVARDCTTWLAEIGAEEPTIVLAAHDEAGHDVSAVRVTLDGGLLTTQLDGRPIVADPGPHTLGAEFPGGRRIELKVVLRATEKDRLIALDLPPAPPPAPKPIAPAPAPKASRHGLPLATWVLGGVGVVALGSFGAFALSGRSRESHLDSTCRPNCSQDDLAGVHRSYLAADISLGVAIVAVGVATWFALTDASTDALTDHARPDSAP